MWFSGWIRFKGLGSVRRSQPDADRADMGVEIGLDQSLDSMLPPLLGFVADKSHRPTSGVLGLPLGTDQRSHRRAAR